MTTKKQKIKREYNTPKRYKNGTKKKSRDLTVGDYVLATKWRDGSPLDAFCVGFFHGMLGDRYLVEDDRGCIFRANGFRRCERIQKRTGDILVAAFPIVGDRLGKSLWYWRKHLKELRLLTKTIKIWKKK